MLRDHCVKIKSPESDGKEWLINPLVQKISHGTVRLDESEKSGFFTVDSTVKAVLMFPDTYLCERSFRFYKGGFRGNDFDES